MQCEMIEPLESRTLLVAEMVTNVSASVGAPVILGSTGNALIYSARVAVVGKTNSFQTHLYSANESSASLTDLGAIPIDDISAVIGLFAGTEYYFALPGSQTGNFDLWATDGSMKGTRKVKSRFGGAIFLGPAIGSTAFAATDSFSACFS